MAELKNRCAFGGADISVLDRFAMLHHMQLDA